MTKERCERIIAGLTGKRHVYFTDRGNRAIKLVLKLGKKMGKTRVLIQDQGGWMTYKPFSEERKLEVTELPTDFGILSEDVVLANGNKESLLLINSMPGYFAEQKNMEQIHAACKEKDVWLVNDVAGSIGTPLAKIGDIIIGSFGRWKPVNNEYGGFIATDDLKHIDFFEENQTVEVKEFYDDLYKKLRALPERLKGMHELADQVKVDLERYDIIHREENGFNVVVRYRDPQIKEELLSFCASRGYEFTECPRYIRVLIDAISIELKRIGE